MDVAEASSDGVVRSKLDANRDRIAGLSRSKAELDAAIPQSYAPGSAGPAASSSSQADSVRASLKAACAELQVGSFGVLFDDVAWCVDASLSWSFLR